MKSQLLVALVFLLSGCITMDDSSVMADMSEEEIEKRKAHPVEPTIRVAKFSVPMSHEQAYKQFQAAARRCWQRPALGGFSGVLEEDIPGAQKGYSRMAMRLGGTIFSVVTIRPNGDSSAAVDLRTFQGDAHLETFRSWFKDGSNAKCDPPDTAPTQPDRSRQPY